MKQTRDQKRPPRRQLKKPIAYCIKSLPRLWTLRRRRARRALREPVSVNSRTGLRLAGRPVEIWFQDEARVGQQGTLTRIWAKRGTRPRIRRDRRFTWAYLFGAICPARGTGAALVMPTVSIEAMNKHLAEISQCVSVSAIALLILDGAGWHGSPRLVVPANIVLLPLPPYAPELSRLRGSAAILTGRLFDDRGNRMSPTHANKRGVTVFVAVAITETLLES